MDFFFGFYPPNNYISHSWSVFLDLTSQNYIPLSENERNEFGQRIQKRYHRNAQGQIVQISDPMEVGEFF
jgi:hypothetical protein